LLGAPAVAGIDATTFQVTATVDATCTIFAPDLPFGAIVGDLDAAAMVRVICTNSTVWNIDHTAATGPATNIRNTITATIVV
jgi:Spore Coat Protein U domain